MLGRIGVFCSVFLTLVSLDAVIGMYDCPGLITCAEPKSRRCFVDVTGCFVCMCRPGQVKLLCAPLMRIRCRNDQTLRTVQNARGCPVYACVSRPVIKLCKTPDCVARTSCLHGFKYANGCISPTCQCNQARCPQLMCFDDCPLGFRQDAQGCPSCECRRRKCRRSNCHQMVCAGGSITRRTVNGCTVCSCLPVHSNPNVMLGTQNIAVTNTSSNSTTTLITSCPSPTTCPNFQCKLGQQQLQRDRNGCTICTCKNPVCPLSNCDRLVCPPSTIMRHHSDSGCSTCFCRFLPNPPLCSRTVTCPKVVCLPGQEQFEIDSTRCLRCACVRLVLGLLVGNAGHGKTGPICPPWAPKVTCFASPCRFVKCRAYPAAQCIANYCGGCSANFYLNGQKVYCGGKEMIVN